MMYRHFFKRVPTIDKTADGLPEERLAGTGTTEAHSVQKMPINALGGLSVGAAPIRVVWSGTKGTTARVATTSLIIPAYVLFEWYVTAADCYVSIEAADGIAAYEAFVFYAGR